MTAMHFVNFSGGTGAVAVYQTASGVWVAKGEHRGVSVRVEGPSDKAAIARWHDAALVESGSGDDVLQVPLDGSSKRQPRSAKELRARKKTPAQRK